MAYNNVSDAVIKKVAKRYGDDSPELTAIQNIAKARIPYECIAELLLEPVEDIKRDLTGLMPLEGEQHTVLINCVNALLPLGIERGLLPCRDSTFTTEILRVLVELLQLKRENSALQAGNS